MIVNKNIGRLIYELEKGNKAEFSRKIGVEHTTVNNWVEATSISSKNLESIKKVYPTVNLNWLIANEGKMLLMESMVSEPDLEYTFEVRINVEKHIYEQSDQLRTINNHLENIDNQIKKLRKFMADYVQKHRQNSQKSQ